VPAVVVAGPDNAAVELVEEGTNGAIAPSDAAGDLGAAIVRVHEGGAALRDAAAAWFRANAERLSFEHSFQTLLEDYGSE
jgi:glycosyltransferase involved in cell wall biosynthesis